MKDNFLWVRSTVLEYPKVLKWSIDEMPDRKCGVCGGDKNSRLFKNAPHTRSTANMWLVGNSLLCKSEIMWSVSEFICQIGGKKTKTTGDMQRKGHHQMALAHT